MQKMSKEKQIEEMAKAIAVARGYGCTEQDHCDMSCQVCKCGCIPHEDAQILYNAGYRKQSLGEWTRFEVNSSKGYGQVYYQHRDCEINPTQLFPSTYHFCPNCGANMRKEDEGK